MRVLVGTSGFSYKEWKGPFYPEKLKNAEMLRFYAERFPTVEINNTFYRMPTKELLGSWAEQVPAAFSFVLKAPQKITHIKRLGNAAEEVSFFLEAAKTLADRLGCVFFQTPPYLRKDLARLAAFLDLLPRENRAAFEFRHASWFDEEVYALLRSHDAALCLADTDEESAAAGLVATASWGYLRLRRVEYGDDDLSAWADRIKAQPWDDAFVFFKHEDAGTGPKLALRLMERL